MPVSPFSDEEPKVTRDASSLSSWWTGSCVHTLEQVRMGVLGVGDRFCLGSQKQSILRHVHELGILHHFRAKGSLCVPSTFRENLRVIGTTVRSALIQRWDLRPQLLGRPGR